MDFDAIEITPDWQHARNRAKAKRHYDSGRYHRPQSSIDRRHTTLLDKPICAIDGEGGNDATGKHHYRELRAVWPDGRAEITAESLTTEQCLSFIVSLPKDHTIVIYGGSYDSNMWLRDLHHNQIDRLLDNGKCGVSGYSLYWVERKIFTVRKGKASRTVYDVLANFQRKFADACEAWGVGTPEDLQFIRYMKDQRDHLADLPAETVARYNWLECEMLGELCRRFFAAIKATDLKPKGVYGPGALAAAAMTKYGVRKHMADVPEHIREPVLCAYKGGRFDTSVLGEFTNVHQYDIKSAYPDQIRDLPCLAHSEWVEWKGEPLERFSLYHVEWSVPPESPWPPFPWRAPDGMVYYPIDGATWTYGDEIMAAIELFPTGITVTHGYRLITHCTHQPFHFVEPLFKLRQSMPKLQGEIIKLVLNSMYGKTAQQVGGRNGNPPPFQCFPWAGMTTSGTRAKLLRGMVGNPKAVIGVATDSLVARRKLDLPIGKNLGEWDDTVLTKYAQVGNGLYHGETNGNPVERSRGLERTTIDWEACMREYKESRGMGIYRFTAKTRFITLRESRMREERDYYACRWVTEPRSVSFMPSRRWWGHWAYGRRVCEPLSCADLSDRYHTPLWESAPFRVKTDSAEVNANRARFHPGVTDS